LSVLAARRIAASRFARVAFFVSSTLGFMPLARAIPAMSFASNSQAASGPSQPAYAAALTAFRPRCNEIALGLAMAVELAAMVSLPKWLHGRRGA
jgi:hypothetical protein